MFLTSFTVQMYFYLMSKKPYFYLLFFLVGGKHRQGRKKPDKKKVDNGIDPSLSAIAYLNQLINTRKEKPPEYTLKADAGPSQKGLMRFQIEVCMGGLTPSSTSSSNLYFVFIYYI